MEPTDQTPQGQPSQEPAADLPPESATPEPVQAEPDPSSADPSRQPTWEELSPSHGADDEDADHEAGEDDGGDALADVHPDVIEPNPEALPGPEASTADATGTVPEATAEPAAEPAAPKPKKPKKPTGPDPAEVTRRIGRTNQQALAYVLNPDPKLSRLSRKVRESLITEVPPVTAGALLGPAALARHFIASAAAGRYRDLFALWELFRARPDECKPVLAERQRALERARQAMIHAVKLGLAGQADRVAEDVSRAQGLIWTWLRELLTTRLTLVGRRPAIAAALLEREPDLVIPLPADPDDRWLAEAAAVKQQRPLPAAMDELLAAHIERLPATVATLSQVAEQYPERLEMVVDRIDLDSDNIGALLAWTRDHGMADRIRERIVAQVDEAVARGRAEGLAAWHDWRERGVDVGLPESLRAPTIEGLDLARPESADLIALLIKGGAPIDPQAELEQLAERNRQLAEKAYESFVCAGLDVHLPLALEGNPIVRDGTRCPACQAWTWVRPGHERRCPRRQEPPAAAT